MNIEEVVANVSEETTVADIRACEPFVLEVTSFYPSGSGVDKYLWKGSKIYRTADCSLLLKSLQHPHLMRSKFKAYSGTLT
jgi:hypothetical protein